MNNVMAIVFPDNKASKMDKLTEVRSLSAVPFGGRYRIIDFTLSNLANSGITNVGVATQYKYHSLLDHILSGRPWDLDRKTQGLYVLPPNLVKEVNLAGERNNVSVLKGIESYIEHCSQEYVIIVDACTICNINFKDLYHFHMDSGADVSLMYFRRENDETSMFSQHCTDEYEIDETGRVTDIFAEPRMTYTPNKGIKVMMLKKELMSRLVDNAYSHKKACNLIDMISENIDNLKVMGMEYTGYVRVIDDVNSYYKTSMELLEADTRKRLFRSDRRIMTKVRDNSPTRHFPGSKCSNSLIANGCEIAGHVENSILFRNVVVEEGATVVDSIIMQDTVIRKNTTVRNVIIDKDCKIGENKTLIGQPNYPFVISKGEKI